MKGRGIALACVLFLPAIASAEPPRTGFWGGLDAGVGELKRDYSVTESVTHENFTMNFRGGYAWQPQLLLGAEIGGWLLEASSLSDPSKGVAIETLLAYAQYYPTPSTPYFLKGGLGAGKYWSSHAGEQSGSGPAAMLGAGRDFRVSERWSVTAAGDFSRGRASGITSPPGVTQDVRYRALTFRIGLAYR